MQGLTSLHALKEQKRRDRGRSALYLLGGESSSLSITPHEGPDPGAERIGDVVPFWQL